MPTEYTWKFLLHTDHTDTVAMGAAEPGLLAGLCKFLECYTHDSHPLAPQGAWGTASPSSWLAEEVVRLNCCSKYFPKKAAKPATTAISMQAARTMQVNTGLDSRCLVTCGITAGREKQRPRVTHAAALQSQALCPRPHTLHISDKQHQVSPRC